MQGQVVNPMTPSYVPAEEYNDKESQIQSWAVSSVLVELLGMAAQSPGIFMLLLVYTSPQCIFP
jgi:hypothetical protein